MEKHYDEKDYDVMSIEFQGNTQIMLDKRDKITEKTGGNFGIIPYRLMVDENVKDFSKVLFTMIVALTVRCEYCFAGNDFFANEFNCGKNKISLSISELKENGYIRTEYDKYNRRKIYPLIDKRGNKK